MKEYIVMAIVQETIDAFDARNAPELIRCKDCRFLIDHYGFMNDGYCANMRDKYDVKFKPDKNFFCADGERK